MAQTRRTFIAAAVTTAAGAALPRLSFGAEQPTKKHIVTLSFDDGFKKSSIKTAEIYEKHKLSACINVVASAHMKDFRPPITQTSLGAILLCGMNSRPGATKSCRTATGTPTNAACRSTRQKT